MDFWQTLILAFVALKTNKVRSFLTVLGIIIGVSSVILLVSIGSGLQEFVTNQFESLGANSIFVLPGKIDLKGGGQMAAALLNVSKFELADVNRLEKSGGAIRRATPAISGYGTLTFAGKTVTAEVAGVWPNYLEIANWQIANGRLLSDNDNDRFARVVVLGSKPAEELFKKSNPVGKTLTLNGILYKVIGVLESKGGGGLGANIDNHIFIPYSSSTRLLNKSQPYTILVEATSQASVPEAIKQIEKILLKRLKKDDFTILEQKELLSTINQFLGAITLALVGIASISLLVGGIGIMNIMLVSVTERTREIGLRKAVGATERVILFQFLIESLTLSLIGGTIGVLIGSLGSILLRKFIQTAITVWSLTIAFFVSSAVGIIFGVFPAYRASKLNPIDALRYE
jgi:putative ABC transport system permease protein